MTTVMSPTRRAAAHHGTPPRQVTDCAEWAWWVSAKTCLAHLDPATVAGIPATRVHHAAVCLMAGQLVLEWGRRGYTAHLVTAAVFAPAPDTDTLHTAVADAAAAAIDPVVLLAALAPGALP